MTIEYNRQAYTKVFDDLDKFRDFCRFEGKVFNEADMYKNTSDVWQQYQRFLKRVPGGRKFNRNNNYSGNRNNNYSGNRNNNYNSDNNNNHRRYQK
jgi:hypothetical protein